jgi:hypothetical protein
MYVFMKCILTAVVFVFAEPKLDSMSNSMERGEEIRPTAEGGILMDFVENSQRLPHFSV